MRNETHAQPLRNERNEYVGIAGFEGDVGLNAGLPQRAVELPAQA
ncbi:hypothetical protein MAV100_11850 [Mycobacterium avium subsp. hominissuis 100]|nr:hypothetical protein MAV100_11850 [Mycobacterium avium subsp. hominissuis 100]